MHAARIEHSPRLQRVNALLSDGRWRSTREIMSEAQVCAVNSCVSELRANGLPILCRRDKVGGQVLYFYRLVTKEDEHGPS